nr:ribosomal protein S1 [Roya anglica]QIQ22979.1 ribosomal protein S1 [Roya anglica]
MSFQQLFSKSNSSLNQLKGNVLQCSIAYSINKDLMTIDTGLKTSIICLKSELDTFIYQNRITKKQNTFFCNFRLENLEMYGEPLLLYPKNLQKISRRYNVWSELFHKVWRLKKKNCVNGFIFNSVRGGYAVAIAGHIAFLPKSLCKDIKIFCGKFSKFAILNMNPKIGNIVVKEYINEFDNEY